LRKLKAENDLRRWKLGWGKQRALSDAFTEVGATEVIPFGTATQEDLDFQRIVEKLKANGFKPGRVDLRDFRSVQRAVKDWFEANGDAFNNKYFLKNLAFLSLLFVPSGAVLLWSNPSWETMQAGKYETIPQWLVGIFTTTNVTQGILGFYNTYKAAIKGKYLEASLHTILSYLGFFFILANGWDNKGYQRFFSKNRESFDNWSWTNVLPWAFSDVVAILLTYGGAFLPLMYYWIVDWLLKGQDMEKGLTESPELIDRIPEARKLFIALNEAAFGFGLGGAATATVLVRHLGWAKGMTAWAGIMGLSLATIGPRLAKRVLGVESLKGAPVEEIVAKAIEEEKELAYVS
jgi:hypothetical protein